MKKLLMLGIALIAIGGLIKLLDMEKQSAINSCMNNGHSYSYCEYHAN